MHGPSRRDLASRATGYLELRDSGGVREIEVREIEEPVVGCDVGRYEASVLVKNGGGEFRHFDICGDGAGLGQERLHQVRLAEGIRFDQRLEADLRERHPFDGRSQLGEGCRLARIAIVGGVLDPVSGRSGSAAASRFRPGAALSTLPSVSDNLRQPGRVVVRRLEGIEAFDRGQQRIRGRGDGFRLCGFAVAGLETGEIERQSDEIRAEL